MFVFGLKPADFWVTTALLVLGFSICPHSGYPYDEDVEDPMVVEENQTDDKDQEAFDDKDDDLEEEQDLEETAEFDNGGSQKCIKYKDYCSTDKSALKCCGYAKCRGYFLLTCKYKGE